MTAPLPDLREGAEAWVTEHVSCPNPNCKRLNLCAECMTIVSDLRERDRQWRDMVVDALARLAEVERERDEARATLRDARERDGRWRVMHYPIEARPILYTDEVGGRQTMRDDLWAVTTAELNQCHAAEQRLARLRPLVRWAFGVWDWLWGSKGMDGEDGWDLAERAEKCGLAARVKYDPEVHGETEADPGDEILYPGDFDPTDRAWATEEER